MTQAISSQMQYLYPANLLLRLLATVLDMYVAIFFIAAVLIGVSAGYDIPLSRYSAFLHVDGVDVYRYGNPYMPMIWNFVLLSYLPVIVTILLSAVFECSPARSSLGKSVLGIRVFDTGYPRVTFGQALRRNVFKYLWWFLVATGVLMSLYLIQVQESLDYLLPQFFLGVVVIGFSYGIISIFIILGSDLNRGIHCRLTNTVVVRDLDSSRDTITFFLILTLILVFLNVMYLDDMYYGIKNIRPKIQYELVKKDEEKEDETVASSASKQKVIEKEDIQNVEVVDRKFPSVSQKEAIKTLRRGEAADKLTR